MLPLLRERPAGRRGPVVVVIPTRCARLPVSVTVPCRLGPIGASGEGVRRSRRGGRVEAREQRVPVVRFGRLARGRRSGRLGLGIAPACGAREGDVGRRRPGGAARGGSARERAKVETALGAECGSGTARMRRVALSLARRRAAVEDGVKIIEPRARDGGEVVVGGALFGILKSLEVVLEVVKGGLGDRGGGCRAASIAGSGSGRLVSRVGGTEDVVDVGGAEVVKIGGRRSGGNGFVATRVLT